ncbi:MAG: XRE family transcriptional regulator [Candidatus Competibacteraceae bacterium]|nr:MAG: XRE family transcriptional regulator [Candidatus Competibacteraceae bacterium]
MNETMTTGARVRQLRLARDWSMEDLAARVGCTANTINLLEHATTRQSRFLPQIAKALGTTVEWLVRGDRCVAEESASYRPVLTRIHELAESGRLTLPQVKSLGQLAETFADTRR